jgi:DNA-directed RNA polymerase subunit RPC12/RpoP
VFGEPNWVIPLSSIDSVGLEEQDKFTVRISGEDGMHELVFKNLLQSKAIIAAFEGKNLTTGQTDAAIHFKDTTHVVKENIYAEKTKIVTCKKCGKERDRLIDVECPYCGRGLNMKIVYNLIGWGLFIVVGGFYIYAVGSTGGMIAWLLLAILVFFLANNVIRLIGIIQDVRSRKAEIRNKNTSSVETHVTEPIICHNCGKENEKGRGFCVYCGSKQELKYSE